MENEEINIKFIFPTLGYDEYMTFDLMKIIDHCPRANKMGNIIENVRTFL